jgi:transcriptional regulator with XRE-family HTH domain
MPLSALTGSRLREHRLAAGLRQADVAIAAGISASYLNLIEHNRRKVSAELLDRLASALRLDAALLSGRRDAGLLDDLRQAASRSEAHQAELDRLEEFVSRFPGWAGLLSQLDRRALTLERAVEALNDRMNHDPYLSQSLHEVLSSLASVRATAAILAETPDLPENWAERFHRNLHQDSERLAAGAEALVAYLDAGSAIAEQGIAAPQEEVEEWLYGRGWSISDAEAATGLTEEIAGLASSAARSLARDHVARALADAQVLPEEVLAKAIAEIGPDPVALAARTGCDPMVALRRLASVEEVSAGLVLCDASGTMTLRKPATGFPLPRFGAACPLWPLYSALARPYLPVEARVEVAGQAGRRHKVIAISTLRHPQGLRGPELREAGMLILPDKGDGPVLPVGSSCRVCPRRACLARREPSILTPEGTV